MITLEQYFGPWFNHPDATLERKTNAAYMLSCVKNMEEMAVADGVEFPDNPETKSGVSGQKYGGFRPHDCPQGALHSNHKEGYAVDRYDPEGLIDDWCMNNVDKLIQCGLYIEHPSTTKGWSHWSSRAPLSGHRVFYP